MSLPPSLPQIPQVLAQPPSSDVLPTHPLPSRSPPLHVIETGPNNLITPQSQEQAIYVPTQTHTPVSNLSETADANPRRSSHARRPPANQSTRRTSLSNVRLLPVSACLLSLVLY